MRMRARVRVGYVSARKYQELIICIVAGSLYANCTTPLRQRL